MEAFKEIAKRRGVTASELLRSFVYELIRSELGDWNARKVEVVAK